MSMQQSGARRERLREERAQARSLGVAVNRKLTIDTTWTEAEDETLRRLYPDYEAIANVLRHRTYAASRCRCHFLGIQKKKHVWTTTEENILKRLWTSATSKELKSAFPGMNYTAIFSHGVFMKLGRRGSAPFAPTGNWLCDAIRDRCRELGYSMSQLDEMANTRTYFEKAEWRHKAGHRWQPMVKAAKALGGELRVEWPD